ncbi:proline--tRNA ligase [Paenibacillus spiritus]|uniref:Proline--tRNA ligase n=1 Tax=Paenibacillus spiritus TaxID=2496557 RepID=A0A5J5GFK1_9BACL|nr:proline--tRNA ligase [Paenibacillus spiritus]KAA9006532.1 proline--tRNA ligase [Paenibacillus spiritus]
MKQSQMLIRTLREQPAEADTKGHALLLRAGYIRQLAAGVYSYLPLAQRVLSRIERIIREEMEAAGAAELRLPSLHPAELLRESGRYELYGRDLMLLEDRHGREFALGPTHEEVVTALVGSEVSSYRQLPVSVYQIGTKFRDERRPRFGLLRGREFLMKDAYSFGRSEQELDAAYQSMFEAYHRIFTRCGLNFRAAEADSGAIGGSGSHEFMALAAIGEDDIAVCSCCGYAANVERAETRSLKNDRRTDGEAAASGVAGAGSKEAPKAAPKAAPERFATPGIRTVEELQDACGLRAEDILKTLIYAADGQVIAVLVRGDHEVNELKVKAFLKADTIELADEETVLAAAGTRPGFVGPVGLSLPLLADHAAMAMAEAVAGAGAQDEHWRHVVPGRDFCADHTGDFRLIRAGDACPRCESGSVGLVKGIEIGHVFKLGTRYSGRLHATFRDERGQEQPLIMGCYGIGVSRLLAAVAEQSAREDGLCWPPSLAPFTVHLIPVAAQDGVQMELARRLYETLRSQGMEVLLDDREERPGVKFKDAELIGIPWTLIVGRGAAEGRVELRSRSAGTGRELAAEEALAEIIQPGPDLML